MKKIAGIILKSIKTAKNEKDIRLNRITKIIKSDSQFTQLLRYSLIAFAATFPAPIALITVAAPVTASPPA